MNTRTLYLFPDTNLFIQCLPLEELDWSEWAIFEEVHLIVCRTVQRELDKHKNRGNDRVGKRARKTCSLFRSIIRDQMNYKLIREASPQVKLFLEASSLPSSELFLNLDYNKPDDEIVGHIYRYQQQHTKADVRLLTNDIGPIMTAKNLNLPFVSVNDKWLIPPESNETEREITHLKNKITQLEKAEPQFRIKCIDGNGLKVESLEFEYPLYEPLREDDISVFIDSLRNLFPLATDFGPCEPAEKEHSFFTPASNEEIARYKDRKYPDWIQSCRKFLSKLHEALRRKARQPILQFLAINEGTRPGKDILIKFIARGNFHLRPPQREDKELSEKDGQTELRLPLPPKTPRGQWVRTDDSLFNAINAMTAFSQNFIKPSSVATHPIGITPRTDRLDPNAFYYKPDRPMEPVESFNLECEQWRHGTGEEHFDVEIHFDKNLDEIAGAIECLIHAENLSTPFKKIVPIRIAFIKKSTKDCASNLIKNVSDRFFPVNRRLFPLLLIFANDAH